MQIYTASYVLPVSSPPIPGGAVAVQNGVIQAVGSAAELRKISDAKVTDLPGCAIIPGLVNAHTHLELTHFPAWKVRKDLDYLPRRYVDWIEQVVKIRRALTPGELELSLREGLRLCIESGTTSVGEILSDFSLASVYEGTPLTGRIFLEVLGHDPLLCEPLLEKVELAIKGLGGTLRPGISPHTPHTVSQKLFRKVQELAARLGLPKAVHLSESLEEVSFMFDSTGPIAERLFPMARWDDYLPAPLRATSTSYLDGLGVLDDTTLVIHAVHVTPADAAILKERGVSVVLCPRSNDRLNVGRAPHHLLRKAGIPLALGTDSLASNDSLSLWDEIRYLREMAPDDFSAAELIAIATLGGARALGIEDQAGSLEPGKKGNFLVFSNCDPGSGRPVCDAIVEKGRLEQVYIAGRSMPRPPAPPK